MWWLFKTWIIILWIGWTGGQGVKPPIRKYKELAPINGCIKVGLGQVSVIYFLSFFQTYTHTQHTHIHVREKHGY